MKATLETCHLWKDSKKGSENCTYFLPVPERALRLRVCSPQTQLWTSKIEGRGMVVDDSNEKR